MKFNFIGSILGGKTESDEGIKTYLVRASSISVFIKICGFIVSFISSVIWARLLGPMGYGNYSYIFAIISIIVIVAQLGLPRLLIREVAYYVEERKFSLLGGALKKSKKYILLSCSLVVLLSAGIAIYGENIFLDKEVRLTFVWAIPLLMIIPLLHFNSSVLKGLKEIKLAMLPELIIKPIFLLGTIGTLLLIKPHQWFTSYNFMMVVSISFFFALAVSWYWVRKSIPLELKRVNAFVESKGWLKKTLPFMLMAGLMILNSKIDLVLLGILGTKEQVGLYEVANRVAGVVSFILLAINISVAPLFATLWSRKDHDQLQKVLTRTTQVIFGISLFIAIVIIIGNKLMLEILFGLEYVGAASALWILTIGYLVNSTFGSVGELLNMTGFEKYTAWAIGISAVLNAILNIILIPKWGLEGASLASLISFLFWNSYLGYVVYSKLKLKPSPFVKV